MARVARALLQANASERPGGRRRPSVPLKQERATPKLSYENSFEIHFRPEGRSARWRCLETRAFHAIMRRTWDNSCLHRDSIEAEEIIKMPSECEKARYDASVRALEFELEQFWKRSLFFWGFIGAAFVAFAAANQSLLTQGVVASFGFVCSVTWTLANRGSKFWYENWELKRYTAEVPVTGTLYGGDPKKKEADGIGWLSGRRYSPSKLAIALSDYVVSLWVGLLVSRSYLMLRPYCPALAADYPSRSNTVTLLFIVMSVVYAVTVLGWGCYSKDSKNKTTKEVGCPESPPESGPEE